MKKIATAIAIFMLALGLTNCKKDKFQYSQSYLSSRTLTFDWWGKKDQTIAFGYINGVLVNDTTSIQHLGTTIPSDGTYATTCHVGDVVILKLMEHVQTDSITKLSSRGDLKINGLIVSTVADTNKIINMSGTGRDSLVYVQTTYTVQ